jgi:hypothetical protein
MPKEDSVALRLLGEPLNTRAAYKLLDLLKYGVFPAL